MTCGEVEYQRRRNYVAFPSAKVPIFLSDKMDNLSTLNPEDYPVFFRIDIPSLGDDDDPDCR